MAGVPMIITPFHRIKSWPARIVESQQLDEGTGRQGFTLVELLIVVAIIGILAVIAIPNYLTARERAERSACAGNLRTLGEAIALYKLDFGVFPLADGTAGSNPSPGQTTVGEGPAANGSWDGVPRVLLELEYVTDENVLYCPTLKRRYGTQAKYFRYAYNYSAADTLGSVGGADNIEHAPGDFWIARCLWVPAVSSFRPASGVVYPHGDYERPDGTIVPDVMENVMYSDFRVNTINGEEDFNRQF